MQNECEREAAKLKEMELAVKRDETELTAFQNKIAPDERSIRDLGFSKTAGDFDELAKMSTDQRDKAVK